MNTKAPHISSSKNYSVARVTSYFFHSRSLFCFAKGNLFCEELFELFTLDLSLLNLDPTFLARGQWVQALARSDTFQLPLNGLWFPPTCPISRAGSARQGLRPLPRPRLWPQLWPHYASFSLRVDPRHASAKPYFDKVTEFLRN